MKNYALYKLIRNTEKLKEKRNPMFEKNKMMKFLGIFMFLYYAAILLLLGVLMPSALGDIYNGVASFHVLDGFFIYFLVVDFWCRFILQETPARAAKPYSLLPIRRSFLMKTYLLKAGLSWGNTFWGFFLIPFGLLGICILMGWGAFIGWLLGWWLLFVANGYAYLFCRALCLKHFAWFLLPLAAHVGVICLMLLPEKNVLDMPCTEFLYAFAQWEIWPWLVMAAVTGILFWANFALQSRMVYNEIAKKEDVELKHTTQLNFLNRYGALGEYLKLEMKSRLRNKSIRSSTLVALGLILFFCSMQYFTDVYDGTFMKSFLMLYNYVCLGMMTLISIMCHEGNYIDGLMSRRESILQLLKAKYYFNLVLLLFPLLLVTPLIFIGKISLWMNLGYLFFTAGVLYPIMFQMAVYNKESLPLNDKMTRAKQGGMMQQILSLVLLFFPIGVEKISVLCFGEVWGYIVLIVMGLIGILTEKWWMQNIYVRFMQRRYINMEGFRASRGA